MKSEIIKIAKDLEQGTITENEARTLLLGLFDVSSRFIYLVTNETDRIVESAWSNFEEAKKECQQWEKMKPQKEFMVVELPVNGC